MKTVLRIMLSALLFLVLSPAPTSKAQGTITQGAWSFTYPSFANLGREKAWEFKFETTGSSSIENGDFVIIDVLDSYSTLIALQTYQHRGASIKELTLPISVIYSDRILESDLTKPYNVRFRVSGSSSNSVDLSFLVPMTTLPKRPEQFSEYVKLLTDFSKPIPFPTECTDLKFTYSINDPYKDVQEFSFRILDSQDELLASTSRYGAATETKDSSIRLCPYALEDAKYPLRFEIGVDFSSNLKRTPLTEKVDFNLATKFSKVEASVNNMLTICKKESNIKKLKGACPAGYANLKFSQIGETQWNALTRNPGSQKGKRFIIYGCVAQFDSNTGGSKFRAYILPNPSDRYISGRNSLLTGSAKALLKLNENEAFAAKVTVSGATSYSTIGGKTTVPSFSIADFVKIGDC